MRSIYFIILIVSFATCTQEKKNLAGSPSTESAAEDLGVKDSYKETNLIDQIKLVDLDNQPLDLKQYAGKKVFLNFWATWCKPCIAEMPSIERAQGILEPDGFVFFLASDEDISRINRFKATKDFDLTFVRLETPFPDLGILSIPTTLIIDEQGKIAIQHVGVQEWDNADVLNKLRSLSM